MTNCIGLESAQADHPPRFALLEIGQQGVRTKHFGNNGNYNLNIRNSFGTIGNFIGERVDPFYLPNSGTYVDKGRDTECSLYHTSFTDT